MEPPHVALEDEEECHSNESGWTMYIGSPRDEEALHYDDEENGDGLDCDYGEGAQGDPDDVESDDSMASDASSGPSHCNPLRSGYDGFTQKKEQVKESGHKRTPSKSSKGNQVVEKKERVFINSKGKAPAVVQNNVKVNKNLRVGTRKS